MKDLQDELMALHNEEQADLANSLKEINELANEAYRAKVTASEKEQVAKDFKGRLSALMDSAGVDKISANNCTVSGKIKASATVPKDLGDKLALFKYLAATDLNDNHNATIKMHSIIDALSEYPTLLSMLTINATSFNSWYGKEQEAKIAAGEVDWRLDFIKTFEYYSIGFRKKAGK